MLKLSRKVGEQIRIGDNVVLTIVGIDGDRCRVGVTADRAVPVLRHELMERVEQEAELEEREAWKRSIDRKY